MSYSAHVDLKIASFYEPVFLPYHNLPKGLSDDEMNKEIEKRKLEEKEGFKKWRDRKLQHLEDWGLDGCDSITAKHYDWNTKTGELTESTMGLFDIPMLIESRGSVLKVEVLSFKIETSVSAFLKDIKEFYPVTDPMDELSTKKNPTIEECLATATILCNGAIDLGIKSELNYFKLDRYVFGPGEEKWFGGTSETPTLEELIKANMLKAQKYLDF
jgi:hypothetical protein